MVINRSISVFCNMAQRHPDSWPNKWHTLCSLDHGIFTQKKSNILDWQLKNSHLLTIVDNSIDYTHKLVDKNQLFSINAVINLYIALTVSFVLLILVCNACTLKRIVDKYRPTFLRNNQYKYCCVARSTATQLI